MYYLVYSRTLVFFFFVLFSWVVWLVVAYSVSLDSGMPLPRVREARFESLKSDSFWVSGCRYPLRIGTALIRRDGCFRFFVFLCIKGTRVVGLSIDGQEMAVLRGIGGWGLNSGGLRGARVSRGPYTIFVKLFDDPARYPLTYRVLNYRVDRNRWDAWLSRSFSSLSAFSLSLSLSCGLFEFCFLPGKPASLSRLFFFLFSTLFCFCWNIFLWRH